MREIFFLSYEFSYEKCSEIFPKFFELNLCGQKLSGLYRAMRAAMRCEWRRVLKTEMAMRCDAKILAMHVLATEILCDVPPRCENTSDAMPRCRPLRSERSCKIPARFPAKLPCEILKKSPTSCYRSAGRRLHSRNCIRILFVMLCAPTVFAKLGVFTVAFWDALPRGPNDRRLANRNL